MTGPGLRLDMHIKRNGVSSRLPCREAVEKRVYPTQIANRLRDLIRRGLNSAKIGNTHAIVEALLG